MLPVVHTKIPVITCPGPRCGSLYNISSFIHSVRVTCTISHRIPPGHYKQRTHNGHTHESNTHDMTRLTSNRQPSTLPDSSSHLSARQHTSHHVTPPSPLTPPTVQSLIEYHPDTMVHTCTTDTQHSGIRREIVH